MGIGSNSTWRGIVDGRAGCLDVALGAIDGGRVDRRRMWLMGESLGVFDGGGCCGVFS